MSPPEEPLQPLPCRAAPDEYETARLLGGGNLSRGVRIALQIAKQHRLTGASRMAGAVTASQLIAELLPVVRDLEAAAAADVVGTPSGAVFVADPSGALILQTRRATGAHVVATPRGLMVFGSGPAGSDAALALDMEGGQLAITDLAAADESVAGLDLPALAAVVDLIGEAHRQAREAFAKGMPPASARATCPALQLDVQPVANTGNAIIRLAGQSLEIRPLVFLQLLAETASLLAREVARSVADRQQLEGLLEQPSPAVSWERSHGE